MSQSHRLTAEEKETLNQIAGIAFTNPFASQRVDIEAQLPGLPSTDKQARFDAVLSAVLEIINHFEQSGKYDLREHNQADQKLIEQVLLVDVFHRFRDAFLAFITKQDATHDSLPVPFGAEVIEYLERHGCHEQQADFLLALCYQVRRAFAFIDNNLVGRSPSMQELRRLMWNNVFGQNIFWYPLIYQKMEDFSTLILGETGAGKGAVAEAIGRSCFIPYDRQKGRFVESFRQKFIALNLSAFPEGLIESELFGHRKGAFTGALAEHKGLLSRGSPYGALFLDEIGDLSLYLQTKLLQVLQNREFAPVGSHQHVPLQGRILAATHKPIEELIEQGLFRQDFYYRLCTNEIRVPSLRKRLSEDPRELDDLVEVTLTRIVGTCHPEMLAFVHGVLRDSLGEGYPWPGNVRELEQAVRRILLMGTYEGAPTLAPSQSQGWKDLIIQGIEEASYEAKALLADYCCMLYERVGTFEEVSRQTGLDRRTVKKYIQNRLGPTTSEKED